MTVADDRNHQRLLAMNSRSYADYYKMQDGGWRSSEAKENHRSGP